MPTFRNQAILAGGLNFAVTTVTTTYTASIQDCVIECDATSAIFTVTLPAASTISGHIYFIKKIDSSANAITITPNGSDKIDGAGTYSLSTQYQLLTIVSDGTNWIIASVATGGGTSGFSGYSGYSGRSGYSGYSGYSGSGLSGYSGYSGVSGYSGYSGKSGYSGYSGAVPSPLVEAYNTITISSNHAATNASLGNQFTISANANFTLDNPTSSTNGQKIVWRIKQDATGSRLITLDSAFKLGTTLTSVTLSTAANTTDYLAAEYNSDTSHWDVVAFVQGF